MIPAVGGSASASSPAGSPKLGAPRILVLDEALPVRSMLVDILHKLGIPDDEIVIADNAQDALALFRRAPPHVVFAELVGVHAEDGLEVVLEMLDAAPKTRIVLVTSEPREAGEVRAAIRAGAFAFIEKPVRHEKIRQVIQDLEAEEGGLERLR